jgi:hypothetical protein
VLARVINGQKWVGVDKKTECKQAELVVELYNGRQQEKESS